jgi:hypothetical protein
LEIISKRKLWLSGTNNLNDKTERIHGKNKVLKALENFDDFEGKSKVIEIFTRLMGHAQYVCSFSQDGDTLSQWRGYADDGHGFAIGFNSDTFPENHGIAINTSDPEFATSLQRVEYDPSKQDYLIHQIIDSARPDAAATAIPRQVQLIGAATRLASLTITMKNDGFKEEAEWRLVHAPIINLTPSEGRLITCKPEHFKQRVSGKRICTYFEHSFEVSAIEEIMIGPKCLVHNEDLQMLLLSNGIDLTPQHSKSTYR